MKACLNLAKANLAPEVKNPAPDFENLMLVLPTTLTSSTRLPPPIS